MYPVTANFTCAHGFWLICFVLKLWRPCFFPPPGFPLDMLRCESLLGLDQATCSRVLNKNYKLLVSMAPLSNEIRPISSCTPQVWPLERGRAEEDSTWCAGMLDQTLLVSELCACVFVQFVLCFVLFALSLCVHTCVPEVYLWLCVNALWALGLKLPQTIKLHKGWGKERGRVRGREAHE